MANQFHFARAVDEVMKINRHLTGFQLQAFLTAATNEGIIQYTLQEKMNTSNAVMSRTLSKLSKHGYNGRPGLGLLETEQDPDDRRFMIVTLTPKGRALIQRIRQILGDDDGNTEGQELEG